MKRRVFWAAVLSLAVVTAGYNIVEAHGGSGGWFGMGAGHMGGSGRGHMGGGHMMGSGSGHLYDRFSGSGSEGAWRDRQPVTQEEAEGLALRSLGDNPYLKVGKITEVGDSFKVEIVTRRGEEHVDRLSVDKETGRVFPAER